LHSRFEIERLMNLGDGLVGFAGFAGFADFADFVGFVVS
jgi:hypothetical protein